MEAEKLVKTILVLSVTLVLWASPAKCDLDTGLIAYWTFDEGSGTVAYDSAGTNDGTISGAQWTEGIIGGALDFDGVDDYVRVADSHSLTPTNEVTVSAWIHIRSVSWSDRTAIVCKYYWRGDRAYFLGLGKNKDPDKTTVAFVVAETPHTIGYPRYSTTSLLPGQWYHVAATFEPNHEVIYVNSIKETDDSNLSIPDSIPNNSQPLYIGYHKDEEDGFFDGIIDEVALWQRALSAEEVGQLYQQGMAPPVQVAVDIKPGSCPNPLNPASRGILPVAVLGAEDFDVNAIDIASIRLEGVAPVRSNYEDVSAQVVDGNECDCSTTGPDGYADLTLKFRTQNIVAELATQIEDLAQGDMLVLSLTGTLTDGTAIEGQDCVVIVGKVPKAVLAKKSDINEDGIVNNYDFAEMAKYWLEYADLPD